jgi:hypothetical protein
MAEVTLQYEVNGQFHTVKESDTKAAILAAVVLATHNAKPLRILSANGGVLVGQKCLEQQIGFALEPERTQREAVKRLTKEKHDRDARALEQQRQQAREAIDRAQRERRMRAAEESIPGWGSFA